MYIKLLLLFLWSFHCIECIITDSSGPRSNDTSVLVMGLSGSGIFATVEKLVNGNIEKTRASISTVTEYSWQILQSSSDGDTFNATVRIASCPGLVIGKSTEYDARTLETIKEYTQSPSGLNKGFPSIVIVVSRFDDTRPGGINSNFVRMLKSVELLKEFLSPENLPSNIIFHFTHLMGRTRTETRRPNTIIENFKRNIRQYTTFPEPITVTIGENLPDEYDLPRNGSYILLPNKELYPKNLVDQMKSILLARGDHSARNIIETAFENPLNSQPPSVKTFSTDDITQTQETNKFTETLKRSQFEIDSDSDINKQLQETYNKLDKDLKTHPTILQIVQVTFQRLNITSRDHLPKTTVKTVELFQRLPFHMASLALVQDAFNLRQPEFIHPPIVGQGYDVHKDETVAMSPFVMNAYKPTSIGYSFPDNLICKTEDENTMENFQLLQSYEHYKEIRLQDLSAQDAVNSSAFVGTVRSSYNNINPDSDAFVTLSAIKQIRNFKLDLIESSPLDEEFKTAVNDLTPFNQSDKESPKEWKSFFNKYGTHVVTEAYGGGYMEGKASGESINRNLRQNRVLVEIKDNLLSFNVLPHEVNEGKIEISHSFYGGAADARLADAHILPLVERENLLKAWKDSVRSDPRILEMNLKLTPISTIARLVNDEIGRDVGNALNHLLNGTLVYVRVRPSKNATKISFKTRTKTTTTKPSSKIRFPNNTTQHSRVGIDSDSEIEHHPPAAYNNLNEDLKNSNNSKQTASTVVHKLEPLDCSDVPSCIDCPEIQTCPTCPQCPFSKSSSRENCLSGKPADNDGNVLGQSFHIFKDSILPSSPYKISKDPQSGEPGPQVPVGFTVKKMKNPCKQETSATLSSQEYIAVLLKSGGIVIPNANEALKTVEIPGKPRAGYNIIGTGTKTKRVYKEMRYFEVQANKSGLILDDAFVTQVENLSSYSKYPKDCSVRKTWLDFFKNYGTHVIFGGYVGKFKDITIIPGKLALKTVNAKDECEQIPQNKLEKFKGDYSSATVSIHSAKLEKLKDIVSITNNLTHDYDMAVEDLVLGKLKYCD